MPKPVRPFPLISYYWEPSRFPSERNCHGIQHPGERYGLDGCLTYELNAYSGVPAAAHRASYPLVEFYDTSQEVFGILPGADDGGYSLSGEAREAALSRFALPENRKAALNMIRKLNESRDSNDNAL